MTDVDYYRSEAKRITAKAEQAYDMEAKVYLRQAARAFEKLAEIAERSASIKPLD